MKRIYILCIVMISITFLVENVMAVGNKDLINEILNKTKSSAMEMGVIVYYDINADGKDECIKWLKGMKLYDNNPSENLSYSDNYNYEDLLKTENNVQIEAVSIKNRDENIKNKVTINNDKVYCREFQNGYIYGYIESRKDGDINRISIFIRKISKESNWSNLEKQVKMSINSKANNITSYKYIKAKVSKDGVEITQNKIENYLKDIGSKNISTVKVNTGFSSVAYTNKYTPISDNGKLIDFNYAVIKSFDGVYIILGTPIIDITY